MMVKFSDYVKVNCSLPPWDHLPRVCRLVFCVFSRQWAAFASYSRFAGFPRLLRPFLSGMCAGAYVFAIAEPSEWYLSTPESPCAHHSAWAHVTLACLVPSFLLVRKCSCHLWFTTAVYHRCNCLSPWLPICFLSHMIALCGNNTK